MADTSQNQPISEKYAAHQTWGGTYLVVADRTEEFPVALKYAASMAHANKCRIGIFYVMENQGFTHWGNIEKRMRDEQREEAEQIINEACTKLSDLSDMMPTIYLVDGGRMDALVEVIENDPGIAMLILAGGTQGSGPGPLVSHFTGKGLSRLRVPVMIVPDHLAL
ncbi:MAG: universal stress protein [Alphaproteobacteria bacterium]|nr:universal stress protein [Alphaproteobacteria bacterium]